MSGQTFKREQDEVIRRTVINLLAHDMILKDFDALKKEAEDALRNKGELQPESVSALMLCIAREAAEVALYRLFGQRPILN